MCRYVYIEDLVANALIELIEKNSCRQIKFSQLVQYGTIIVKYLRDNNTDAILLVSKEYANAMIINYSDYFEIRNFGSPEASISLKENVNAEDLRENFRAYMSFEMLLAFTHAKALSVLGVAA